MGITESKLDNYKVTLRYFVVTETEKRERYRKDFFPEEIESMFFEVLLPKTKPTTV